MKFYLKMAGEGLPVEVTLDDLQQGFKDGKILPEWSVRRECDADYDWTTVEQLLSVEDPGGSIREVFLKASVADRPMEDAKATDRFRVKVPSESVIFPALCPHCLRPATATISINSEQELVGYYVVYARWRYYMLKVPFCDEMVRRLSKASRVCLLGFFGMIGALIVVVWKTRSIGRLEDSVCGMYDGDLLGFGGARVYSTKLEVFQFQAREWGWSGI